MRGEEKNPMQKDSIQLLYQPNKRPVQGKWKFNPQDLKDPPERSIIPFPD
jgi:hypothetical protein